MRSKKSRRQSGEDPSGSRQKIVHHYEQYREGDRLLAKREPSNGYERWKFCPASSPHRRPASPTSEAARGAYALPLAARGYELHLLDLVESHVGQARAESFQRTERGLAGAISANALSLPLADDSFDVVLFLGPMYHLTEREERLRALGEAGRVLRPGGPLFAAAISRFASLYDGLTRGFMDDEVFRSIVDGDLSGRSHRNPTNIPHYFTDAYFHHPRGLEEELTESGFAVDSVLAVEGPASWLSDCDRWLDDEERRQILLNALRRVEAEPSFLGASSHLLGVAGRI